MANQALFAGLLFDEEDRVVETAVVGNRFHYVIDDDGFRRHIDAEEIDRQVLDIFLEQLENNKDLAVEQMLGMMGKDDIFTKAAVDASLNDVNPDQILEQGIPPQARNMLGMMGFRIKLNYRGEIVDIEQPSAPDHE